MKEITGGSCVVPILMQSLVLTGYRIVCRNKISIRLDYIELRIRINQFEMFVSSLIHKNNIENRLL